MEGRSNEGAHRSAGLAIGIPPNLSSVQHRPLLAELATYLSRQLACPVVAYPALSYDDLALNIISGALQAAWLPPALFVELQRTVALHPVAAAERARDFAYYAAFFTLIDSDVASIEEIPGHSVAWVSPTSASGYIYPRLQLAAHGIDPATAFQEELFYRTHEAVVRAVIDRVVDLGATFVLLDPQHSRKVIRAGWRPAPEGVDASSIQWLEPFGPLPTDVVVTTGAVPAELAGRLGQAFMRIHEVEAIHLAAKRQFGSGRFGPVDKTAYEPLRTALDVAEGKGVEVLNSFRPSHLA